MTETSTKVIKDPSFELLMNAKTPEGQAFANAVYNHSQKLAQSYLQTQYGYYREKMVGVVAIPRGGIPTAKATFSALADHETGDILYIESRIKRSEEDIDILGDRVGRIRPEVIFITDGVIASGNSIAKHFTAIANAEPESVIVLSNCSTEQGMDMLAERAQKIGFKRFEQVTGRIFTEGECQMVNVEGKEVLFVGYNEDKGLDYKLPDFGDAIQPKFS